MPVAAMSMETPTEIHNFPDDDKKVQRKDTNFCFILFAVMPCYNTCGRQLVAFLKSPFKVYTVFLCVFLMVHHLLFHSVDTAEDIIGYVSCTFEAFGLISVFKKIHEHRSVMGISGSSLIMFTISIILRQFEAPMMALWYNLTWQSIALEVFQFASIPLVVSLLWAVFKTYRGTYQESLDKLKAQYLLPACVALAFVLRPSFKQGFFYSYYWTLSFYVDVLALLPQVVMMTFTPGKKIAVPIANFVAVTAVSRCVDLWFWYLRFDIGPQGWWGNFNYSGWIIVGAHVLSLLLVADFMYYYLKARCAAHMGEASQQAIKDEALGVFEI